MPPLSRIHHHASAADPYRRHRDHADVGLLTITFDDHQPSSLTQVILAVVVLPQTAYNPNNYRLHTIRI
jgi:hypothetical protein